jgi:hypothetical protein
MSQPLFLLIRLRCICSAIHVHQKRFTSVTFAIYPTPIFGATHFPFRGTRHLCFCAWDHEQSNPALTRC